jgi:hypothetical protein
MIILDNLTQNYDLVVLNKQGVQIGSANHTGTTPDTVILNNLAQGKDYFGVTHDAASFDSVSCYRMRVYKSATAFAFKAAESTVTASRPDLFVFPNPAHDHLSVNFLSNEYDATDIIIYDLLNRVVYHSTTDLGEGYQQLQIPIADLENGAYQLVISNHHKFWSKGFVKQ